MQCRFDQTSGKRHGTITPIKITTYSEFFPVYHSTEASVHRKKTLKIIKTP